MKIIIRIKPHLNSQTTDLPSPLHTPSQLINDYLKREASKVGVLYVLIYTFFSFQC